MRKAITKRLEKKANTCVLNEDLAYTTYIEEETKSIQANVAMLIVDWLVMIGKLLPNLLVLSKIFMNSI